MKPYKKWLISLLMLFSTLFVTHEALASTAKIYDQAGIFPTQHLDDIKEALAEFEKSAEMDAIVVTNSDASGKSARDYADDFYDSHGFGTGPEKSGILFLIDLNTREYWFSTSGHGIQLFDDQRIQRLLDKGEKGMKEGNYAKATVKVLQAATAHSNNYTFNEGNNQYQRVKRITWYEALISAILALIVAAIFFLMTQRKYQLRGPAYAYPYREQGQLQLTEKEDTLINTATTSRYIPPASSGGGPGGGGSSTHTSSGGSTHGGGGRGF